MASKLNEVLRLQHLLIERNLQHKKHSRQYHGNICNEKSKYNY